VVCVQIEQLHGRAKALVMASNRFAAVPQIMFVFCGTVDGSCSLCLLVVLFKVYMSSAVVLLWSAYG